MKKDKRIFAVCMIYHRDTVRASGPFSSFAAAKRYQKEHGGQIVEIEDSEEVERAHITEKGFTNR